MSVTIGQATLHRMDCLEYMAGLPDKAFDLAIVDPPYGSPNINGGYTSGKGGTAGAAAQLSYNRAIWSFAAPEQQYFDELMRVSANQIIWGANHMISKIQIDSPCWIIWDKKNENTGFADCELAWASFDKAARKFEFMWNGMLQGNMKNKEQRIHPTQKPVALYEWLLTHYAKPSQRILDTHLGSGSSAIACNNLGFEIVGCELDEDYYTAACKRIEQATAQARMFA